MLLRRCSVLFVELDQEPRFSFANLVGGGDGMDRAVRWQARAAHLAAPVTVTLAQLDALAGVPRDTWVDRDVLVGRHAAGCIDSLLALGLLISDDEGGAAARERDAAAREIAWWPLALMAHVQGGWGDVDIQARNERGLMLSSEEMVEAFGAAPEPEYRRRPDGATQPLAAPLASDFDALLAARRTCRNFDGEAVLGRLEFAT
nr:hypothetical protein [Arenimonas sp.]